MNHWLRRVWILGHPWPTSVALLQETSNVKKKQKQNYFLDGNRSVMVGYNWRCVPETYSVTSRIILFIIRQLIRWQVRQIRECLVSDGGRTIDEYRNVLLVTNDQYSPGRQLTIWCLNSKYNYFNRLLVVAFEWFPDSSITKQKKYKTCTINIRDNDKKLLLFSAVADKDEYFTVVDKKR